MSESNQEVENALLEYRVKKLEESDDKQVDILEGINTAVTDMYTEQQLEKQRRNIYVGIVVFVVTMAVNGVLYVADKFIDGDTPDKSSSKVYYDRRIEESQAIKNLEERLRELEEK